ncbi:hypothetical protein Poly30_56910 [Planctomycetes bacterium Poly30]|uniref:DUF3396 domain-containing protein n=1 Tax=Saltatorellus ferox TaxID=2528018 RepID=A0A518F1C6_9BACT|nr:hypothetical protein Poly30_56910 [Planctomycetes bacterium Poly30]
MSQTYDIYLAKPAEPDPPLAFWYAHFTVDGPLVVEDEDISDSWLEVIGSRRVLWTVTVEGSPSDDDLDELDDWIVSTLSQHKAVFIDPQSGAWRTAHRSGSLLGAAPEVEETLGSLAFFFEDVEGFENDGMRSFLSALQRLLPEALPRRFGPTEPMQSRLEGEDFESLLKAWLEEPQFLIMKAKAPFGYLFSSVPTESMKRSWHSEHFLRTSNLVGRLEFQIRPRLFELPALLQSTLNFLVEGAGITNAFYAELRRVKCPAHSWFWRGLPPGPVEGCVVGAPYVDLWSGLPEAGTQLTNGQVLLQKRMTGRPMPAVPDELQLPSIKIDGSKCRQSGFAQVYPFQRQSSG